MTAIYISPPQPPAQATPQVAPAAAAFSGQLEVTTPANAAIMQKSIYMARAARVTAAWISGVDGLDSGASGQTTIRISDHPYDQQAGAAAIDLTLAAGQCRTQAAGEVAIAAGSWLYIFITQATGGHYGVQVGLEITWQEIVA
jgi:hypothetical protein